MSILFLVFRNIAQRKFSIFLTGLSVALGVGLIASTLDIKRQVEDKFSQSSIGYELILGAKGSPLQLVLNTVYQLGNPTGNLPYSTYERYRKSPFVSYAIPMGLGDNYKGFRIVCTTTDFFSKFNYARDKTLELSSGRLFKDDELYAAVVGADVATKTGLKLGDQFVATHGLQESNSEVGKIHDHDQFSVVGILKRTGLPNDKVVYASLPTVWAIHEEENENINNEERRKESVEKLYGKPMKDTIHIPMQASSMMHEEVGKLNDTATHHEQQNHPVEAAPIEGDITAILLKAKAPLFSLQLYDKINREPYAQAAYAVNEIKNLFDIVGSIDWAFIFITVLVIIVALLGVMVALYNSLSERRREIAILRSLGAQRSKIFSIITLEAAMTSFFGALFGILLSKVLSFILKEFIFEKTGIDITISLLSFLMGFPVEVLLVFIVTFVGGLAGMIPAIEAYKTDVAKNLSPLN